MPDNGYHYQFDPMTGQVDSGIIEKLYELPTPEKRNMGDILQRSAFRNDDQSLSAVLVTHYGDTFNCSSAYSLIKNRVASLIGVGIGRQDALFGITGLFAPDSYRAVRGLPVDKHTKEERVYRGSDIQRRPQMEEYYGDKNNGAGSI